MPGAFRAAFNQPDCEDIDMSRRHLKREAVMIEKFWVTAVEYDVPLGAGTRFLMGRRLALLKERFTHSWATSFA